MRPWQRLGLAAGLALGAAGSASASNEVSEIRVFDHQRYTRVVIQLSQRTEYRVRRIAHPPRLYVDIEGVRIRSADGHTQVRDPAKPVQRVRAGQNSPGRVRVVMDLDREGRDYRSFHLNSPFRIVTDIYNRGQATVAEKPPQVAKREVRPEYFGSRPVQRIAIDAGHGGKDPGAIGHGKLREKDIVLRVANLLQRELARRDFDVVLTRSRDRYLTLQQRTQIANRARADVFISLHANAAPRRSVAGIETYLLDLHHDRQTARVAARENGTSIDQLSQLQKILASLRLDDQEDFAARLAGSVHRSLLAGMRNRYGNVTDLGVKRGPFLVLFQADMPAILVEMGFVTNPTEARRMRDGGFARGAARAIADGLVHYREDHARHLVARR
ncbi:MAG: N-acetylmuramoyl-L-alanine amidase [Proteobacteria bacterium]|nr:N-acetylmuramoyl-L-alanine amidase [Pseudomonadota bacterium]